MVTQSSSINKLTRCVTGTSTQFSASRFFLSQHSGLQDGAHDRAQGGGHMGGCGGGNIIGGGGGPWQQVGAHDGWH